MILLAAALMLDGTIEELLRALRDDDIDRRQTAVESLTILGEGGLDAIREARPDADAETRARLAEIEARIEADVRRRTFPGGPEILGLRASLSARWDAERGEVVFGMDVMNVDVRVRHVTEIDRWNVSLPRWSSGSDGARAELEIRAVRVPDDDGLGGGGAFGSSGCRRRVPPPLLRLRPGQVLSSEPVALERGSDSTSLQLLPGLYEARATYVAKKLLPGATADLETPWVAFTVPE